MKLSLIVTLALVVAAAALMPEQRTRLMNRQKFPQQWQLTGFAPKEATMDFVMALKQRNLDQLESLFWAVSTPGNAEYQNHRSYKQIMDIIAPPKAHRDFVKTWLQQQGVTSVEDRGDNLLVTATVRTIEAMFQTQLYTFKHHKQPVEIFRQMGALSVPARLLTYVDMIATLGDFPMIDVMPKITHPAAGENTVVPETLFHNYHVPAGQSAPTVSQGVIEFGAGQYFNPQSLQKFATDVGIPITPLSSKHIIGPSPPVGIEGTLDIQYIAAVAQKGTNWYWTESNWVYEWGAKFSAASDRPDVISISYGWSEAAQCQIAGDECQVLGVDSQQYVAKTNTEFMKIGLQGVTILCASGDSGANGRTDPSCTSPKLRPAFPAASPYLTAVGATQLVNPSTPLSNPPPICKTGQWNCVVGGQETAVSFEEAHFTSGGGFSNYSPMPDYQKTAVQAYLKGGTALPPASMFNSTNRAFPDVASLGNAILIYSSQEGGEALVGGTSASSPSFAGYLSLLNEANKKKTGKNLGFANPLLYKMYADQPNTFTDVTVGDNKCTESGCAPGCQGFMCAAGWDPVTGLGVANVQEMLSYVNNMHA